MEKEEKIPKEFICPITLEIMKDPVIMPDGQTYERQAIAESLKKNPISPLTRKPMNIEQAITNFNLKSMIEKYLNNGSEAILPKREEKVEKLQEIKIKTFKAEAIPDPEDLEKLFINVTIEPEKVDSRAPILLLSMIDVSGSMDLTASQDLKGGESLCFSRLALVKHSLKTIASIMGDEDKMGLIKFSSKAKLTLEPTNTSEAGRKIIFDAINQMHPDGCTNIWDALRIGINEAKKYKDYNIYLILFTDGEPNENPPMGIIPSLKELLSDIKINFTISTFAFGYNVDCKLMEEIANIGNGIYGYCPDCTMVGTIFTNFMANVLSTITSLASIDINNEKLKRKFNIGGLYSSSQRHLTFSLPKDSAEKIDISLYIEDKCQKTINKIDLLEESNSEIKNQYYRNKLIELINKNIQLKTPNYPEISKEIDYLFNEISEEKNKTEYMNNLLIDLKNEDDNHGQVEKAFRDNYFKKWGIDYLYSFLRFHILEQCGNFKDQSLQLYGGEEFQKNLKIGNKIFINLPPPESDIKDYGPTDSNSFINVCYNPHGGCFDGEALVELKEGKKKVKELKKGDVLANGDIVECLVENQVNEDNVLVVEINGVMFSQYHPVEIEGQWVFPCDKYPSVKKHIDSWFNLVLKNKHEVVLNGIKAITLGHNRTDGILKHPYFGTQKVIDALKKYPTYESGHVIAQNVKPTRGSDNLVTSYY